MKRIFLLFQLALLSVLTVSAQHFEWAKTQATANGRTNIAALPSGPVVTGSFTGSITLGSQTFTNSGTNNAYLAAYDTSGNVTWAHQMITNNTVLPHVTVDGSQNVVISGTFKDSLYIGSLRFTAPAGESGVFVAKFSASGTFLWAKSSGFSQQNNIVPEVVVSADGSDNVYIAGNFGDSITFGATVLTGTTVTRNPFVVKYDADGTQLWAVNFLFLYNATTIRIKALATGELYLAVAKALISPATPQNPAHPEPAFHLLKLSATGTISWRRDSQMGDYSLNGLAGIRNIDITTDNLNNVYIICLMQGVITFSDMLGGETYNNPTEKLFLLKYRPDGNFMTPGFNSFREVATGSYAPGPPSITTTHGNGFLIAGSIKGAAQFSGLPFSSSPGSCYNSFVAKIDTAGTATWLNSVPGLANNQATGLAGDGTGKAYITGNFETGASFSSILLNTSGPKSSYLAKIFNESNSITGLIFRDSNSNNIQDADEQPVGNLVIETTPGPLHTRAPSDGTYAVYVSAGNFTVSLPNPPRHYTVAVSHTVNFTGTNQIQAGKNFALQPIPNRADAAITVTNITAARPGFTLRYRLTCYNPGTTVLTDSLALHYDNSLLTYNSATVNPASQKSGRLAWHYQNLLPGESRHIDVTLTLSTNAVLGNSLIAVAAIKPLTADFFQANNADTLTQAITGSYDPNDKQVSHPFLTPAQAAGGQFLDYVIRFQNTGTDTAFTIVVQDSVSSNLQFSSFEIVSASHPYSYRKLDYGKIEWLFSNILLPDSNRNEPASHGFIRYRIKPKTGLILGDEIKERAAIFFDYNTPVYTNTAVTRVANPAAVSGSRENTPTFLLYPNPAQNQVNIFYHLPNNTNSAKILLTDITGREVGSYSLKVNQNQGSLPVNLSSFKNGLYLYSLVVDGKPVATKKLAVAR